jgi:hypothetical protein
VPLKVTVLSPRLAPKPDPLIATSVPILPDGGTTLVIAGPGTTVKLKLLLAVPPTFTTRLPVVAPAGTGTVMKVLVHDVGVAIVPLNVTVLLPCVALKPAPPISTVAPTGA